jgi:hypothetical protein
VVGAPAVRATTPTGGKRRSGTTTKGNRWLGEVLVECAWAAAHTRETYLAAQYWRLARRIGKKKAAVAVGHSILVIAWHLLAYDCDYHDLGGDWFGRRSDHDHRKTTWSSSSRHWATRSPSNPPRRLHQPGILLTEPASSPATPARRRI